MAQHGPGDVDRSLRRRTDRLQSAVGWVLLAAAVVVAVCAGLAATSAYRAGLDRIQRDAATRTTVVGTLLDAAAPVGSGPERPVRVSYVDPQGRARVGQVPVSGPMDAGTAVRVEVDAHGAVGTEPPTPGDAVFSAIMSAVAVTLLGAVLLVTAWVGARSLVAAHNHAAWEREWQLVEPRWSGRGTTAL